MISSVMKNIIFTIALLGLSTVASADVDKKDPYQMIETVADITFKRFANEQSAIRKEPNLLKTIVREELMPYVNYQYACLLYTSPSPRDS